MKPVSGQVFFVPKSNNVWRCQLLARVVISFENKID